MPLTPSQQEAVKTTDRSVVVIAGAGSGKTRVLTEHFRELVCNQQIPVHQILAFTFTEKAAGEIRQRLSEEGILKPEEEALTWVGTIHGFCGRVLRRFGPLLKLDPAFRITSETEGLIDRNRQIKDFLLDELKAKDPLITALTDRFGFSRLKQIMNDLLDERSLFIEEATPSGLGDEEKGIFSKIRKLHQAWQDEKIERGILHFDDLEFLATTLLLRDKSVQKQLQHQFKHILVDELQDTNPLQGILLGRLFNPQINTLFAVGDPKQSIYRFRRADVSLFRKIASRVREEEGKTLPLNETFRLPPRLVSVVNAVFTPLFQERGSHDFFHPMKAVETSEEGCFEIVIADSEKKPIDELRRCEAQWIGEKITRLQLPPEELKNCALLFRAGAPMTTYRDELTRTGIPCQVTRTDRLLEVPAIRDLLHILAYLAGEKGPITRVGILRSPLFGLSEVFIERLIRSETPHFLAPYTIDLFTTMEDRAQWERLASLFTRWEMRTRWVTPAVLLKRIVEDLGILANSSKLQNRLDVEQFLQLIDELEEENRFSYRKLYEVLMMIRGSDHEIRTLELKTAPSAVQLMTIHAAKGLEFETVFLPQLYARDPVGPSDCLIDPERGLALKAEKNEGLRGLKIELTEPPLFEELKKKEKIESREEAKRLLYVAMTRAKKRLVLFLREPPAKKKPDEADNWNDWLWNTLVRNTKNGDDQTNLHRLGD